MRRLAGYLMWMFLLSPTIGAAQDYVAHFEQVDGLIYVEVAVNGSEPVPFLLDTGATGSLVSPATARVAGLHGYESKAIGGPGSGGGPGLGGTQAGEIVHGVSLRAGNFEFPPQDVMVAPVGAVTAGTGHRTDGILSVSRLDEIEIDYGSGVIRFDSADRAPLAGGIPLRLEDGFPLIEAEIGLPQGGRIRGTFLVDTGAKLAGLILTRSFLDRHPEILRCGEHPRIPNIAVFGGEMQLEGGRVASLGFGRYTLAQPFTLFAHSRSAIFDGQGIDGVIGTQLLSRFRIVMDLRRGKLYLDGNSTLDEPILADSSGLRLNVGPPDFHRFKVIDVMAGSPAAEAEMRPGDVVEEIGGRAADDIDLAELRGMLSIPNRRYALTVMRGEDEMHVDLATRELFTYSSCSQTPIAAR